MTIFSKKCLAFPNPNCTGEKDKMINCPSQAFTYNVPDALKKQGYFMGAVKNGDIVIIDKPQNVDEVLKDGTTPKRNGAQHEATAEALGILDGGEPAK
jgi:hypothetical protein